MALSFFNAAVPTITPEELKAQMDTGSAPLLLDVREPHEREISHIGGVHLPLSSLPELLEEHLPDQDAPIVVYCRSGARSARAVAFMQAMGYTNATNLEGGILAWIDRIDPTLTPY